MGFGIRSAMACLVTAFAAASFAQQPDSVRGIAMESAGLAVQIAGGETAHERAVAELAALRKAASDLDQNMQRIEGRAKLYAFGREFARTLQEYLRQLPGPRSFAIARAARTELLATTSDANLRVERALAELGDLGAATAMRLAAAQPPVPEAQRPQVEAALHAELTGQRNLLAQLAAQQQQRLEALRDTEQAASDLERRVGVARRKLTELLFWLPAPPSKQTAGELAPSLAWMVSPGNWREAAAALRDQLQRQPVWPALALLVAIALVALRGRFKRALVSLAPAVVTYRRYRIQHVLATLAITFVLALPGPLALWTAGTLLEAAPRSAQFAQALGYSLLPIAELLLALTTVIWLLERRGMAVGHFGWDEASLHGASRALRRFVVLFLPLMFIATLNGLDHAPFGNRESLGRLAFTLAMICLAVFLVRLFRRRSPLMQHLVSRAPRSWTVRLHPAWFGALVLVPLAAAVLAASGYYVAAGYIFGRTVASVFLAVGAMMLYGLIALWVQVQRSQLARRNAAEAARRRAEVEVEGEAGSDVAEALPPRLDIAGMGEQTRSLLDLFITLLLLGGLWSIWRDALPVVSVVTDYTLWSYADTLDGKAVVHPLTVGSLLLAILIGAVTTVAMRNVGALLDILLLKRFEMQADANYAIKVMVRYALTAAGILLAANVLGIRWGDVQWLIAALSVGLGFGLQEIVANFVSGLIVLAERPIRIGDVVTVGDVTGTVSRIRARATVVVDFENKEVMIPNKAFITERVVNWTLTNRTTRLLLKVGVAYGSDIALVQRVLLDAVRGNSDVLHEPSPSVYFADFGDSSLDFEIRAYVGAFDKRLRVKHEINLAVARVLRENGIEIPFPQRDLHIRSAPEGVGVLQDDRRG